MFILAHALTNNFTIFVNQFLAAAVIARSQLSSFSFTLIQALIKVFTRSVFHRLAALINDNSSVLEFIFIPFSNNNLDRARLLVI
ncbi:MAG: hypothetical protein U9Q66_02280 [Patescibacteria group bacterium]|nr:hypothetical protein [Patescibacteria group bacterium]